MTILFATLWPLLAYQSPGYSWDSSAYYLGGRKAIGVIVALPSHQAGQAETPKSEAAFAKPAPVRGARSISYSVVTYLLSLPGISLLPLVLCQALCIGLLVLVALTVGPHRVGALAIIGSGLVLGMGSALPVFATLAMPDIFAGGMILSVVLLVSALPRSRWISWFLTVLVVASVTAHGSHVALALVMLAVGASHAAWGLVRGDRGVVAKRWAPVCAALLLGVACNLAMSLVGFGEASVAPKHYPFALARSMEDGPARWYLAAHCRDTHYAVCDLYPDGLPSHDILWGPNGMVRRATPRQMDRIRSEEPAIVSAAFAAYPYSQIAASLRNFGRQVGAVGIDPGFGQSFGLNDAGDLETRPPPPAIPGAIVAQQIVLGLSLFSMVLLWRAMSASSRAAVLLAILFILANDAICGVISAPDIRYQNRVLWVLPVLVLRIIFEISGGANEREISPYGGGAVR